MSVNTWKNLAASKQTSNNNGYDGTLYDGSQTLEQAWFEGFKPDAFMTISEWPDEYRFLSPKAAIAINCALLLIFVLGFVASLAFIRDSLGCLYHFMVTLESLPPSGSRATPCQTAA